MVRQELRPGGQSLCRSQPDSATGMSTVGCVGNKRRVGSRFHLQGLTGAPFACCSLSSALYWRAARPAANSGKRTHSVRPRPHSVNAQQEGELMADLSGLKVAVLATDGFEESELLEPMKALKEA